MKHRASLRKSIFIIPLLTIAGLMFSCGAVKAKEPIVTLAEYSAISYRMSYRQAVEIIGTEGTEASSNVIEAIPGMMERTVTIMYQWINEDGSNMNAVFQNDKLIQKAQALLK